MNDGFREAPSLYSLALSDSITHLLQEVKCIFRLNADFPERVYRKSHQVQSFLFGDCASIADTFAVDFEDDSVRESVPPYSPEIDDEIDYIFKKHIFAYLWFMLGPAINASGDYRFCVSTGDLGRTYFEMWDSTFVDNPFGIETREIDRLDSVRVGLWGELYSAGYVFGYIAKFSDKPPHWAFARVTQLAIPFLMSDDAVSMICQLERGLSSSIDALQSVYEDCFKVPYPSETIIDDAIAGFKHCLSDCGLDVPNSQEMAAVRERLVKLHHISGRDFRLDVSYKLVPVEPDEGFARIRPSTSRSHVSNSASSENPAHSSDSSGARVSHLVFGTGTVVAVDGNKFTVDFDRFGRKVVPESFLRSG